MMYEKERYYVGVSKIDGSRHVFHFAPSRASDKTKNPTLSEIKGPFKTYEGAKYAAAPERGQCFYVLTVDQAEEYWRAETETEAIAIRAEGEETARHPGKFEGCARYMSYFYEQSLDGCCDQDGPGGIISVEIGPRDKVIWPELKRRKRVRFVESDSGFIYEV